MNDTPLVSAIMPVFALTSGQQEMVDTASASFLSQDWPDVELLVIDDSPTPIDLTRVSCLPHRWTRYVRLTERMKIGPKRNLACELASGDIIVHFDSDDWSAPSRIRDQVERLLISGKSVSGYHSMLFWDGDGKEAFKYKGSEDYSLGTGLCYRKTFWQKHSFVPEGPKSWEDNVFVQAARNENEIVAVDAGQLMVARIHAGNTCPKKPREHPLQWSKVDVGEIPQDFFAANEKAVSHAL